MINEIAPFSFLPYISIVEVERSIDEKKQCCDIRIFAKISVIKKGSKLSKNIVMKLFVANTG